MTSLLEVPEIRRQAFPVSVEMYHRLTEGLRTELLRGTILGKMSKSPFRQIYADRLHRILSEQITPEYFLRREGPLTLADSEPEPDVAVVHGPDSRYLQGHPVTAELVVEIAVSSVAIDRVKAAIYAEAGVKEYWIVRPEEKQVEVYRQPRAGNYAERSTAAPPTVLECAALASVRVDLGAFFA